MRKRPAGGFTLIELLIVMVIIGILIAFILTAAMSGARRAEERATQGLITKIETGLMDRLEALLTERPDVNKAHRYLAANFGAIPGTNYSQRSYVIAQYDYIRSELPDTFIYDPTNADYPVNFCAVAYNTSGTPVMTYGPYILPLGNGMVDNPTASSYGVYIAATATTPQSPANYNPSGTGIFGASYSARAALYKNLGFAPAGYDGVDNNGDGLVDNFSEGGTTQVTTNLQAHKPNTARSEVLYAILVEGQGPLGSIFNADDFSDKEVQDTDGDGLPEFVDAWGKPLQFYRWPILFHSDLQRGQRTTVVDPSIAKVDFLPPYDKVFEQRELDPLDPNQQLVAPAWCTTPMPLAKLLLATPPPLPTASEFFQSYFHILTEPTNPSGPNFNRLWDRSANAALGYYFRRAFYSKFLIASSGPDGELGIFQAFTTRPSATAGNIARLNLEGYAFQGDPTAILGGLGATSQPTVDLQQQGLDDITNHNLMAPGGGIQ